MLSDEKKRSQYDQFGEDAFKNGNGFHSSGGSFEFNDIFKDFGGFGSHDDDFQRGQRETFKFSFGGFDDLFNDNDDEEDDPFGDFAGGFGDSFFGSGDHMWQEHRENNHFQRTARHAQFQQTRSGGKIVVNKYLFQEYRNVHT